MTSPITPHYHPLIHSQPKVAAARDSKSAKAPAPASAYHTGTKPKDCAELSPEARANLKNILLTPLKAEPRDELDPRTLHFDALSFLYHLRECLRNENTPSIKIFDTFLLIGSGVTSCINPEIKPSDLDFLIRREVLIDEATFNGIADKKAYIKALLDHIRNQIEDVGLAVYRAHDSEKILNRIDFFQTYIRKSRYENQELKEGEPRDDRWGMLHVGNKFEVKYEITISVVSKGKVIKRFAGLRAYYGIIAQDLFIILDPLLDSFDFQTFDFDTCKFPIFSMDHLISEVMDQIRANILSDDHVDGKKFPSILRKFTLGSGLIDPLFFQDEFKDFLRIVSLTDMEQQLCSQLREKVVDQKMGTLFCLLNISFLADRIKAENQLEIDTSLATIAKNFLSRPDLKLDHPHLFYWQFCKILFLLGGREKVSEDIISIKQYEKTTYQLLLPSSLLETFLLFFKKWEQFNTTHSPDIVLELAKEMLPQLRLDGYKNDIALLNYIIKKMRAYLSTQEKIVLLHYLLFNHAEILEKGELKNKLLSYGPYFNLLPMDMREALLSCNIRQESIEKTIRSIFLTHDPHLAKLGINLLIHASSFDRLTTLKYTLQLALEFPWDDSIHLESFLSQLCLENLTHELKISDQESRIKSVLIACARSSDLEIKSLSLDLLQRVLITAQFSEVQINSLIKNLIFQLKDFPELISLLHPFFKDKKVSFFMHVMALELKIHPFTLDKTLVELERLDPDHFTEEERIYIHEVYSHLISDSIPLCNRIQFNNLLKQCPLLFSLGKKSLNQIFCVKLSKKAFEFKESVFELIPVLGQQELLSDPEIEIQIKEITLKKVSPQEVIRLVLLLKPFGPTSILSFMSFRALATERTDKFSKSYAELASFMNEESKIKLFEQKLDEVIESKNFTFALSLIDLLIKSKLLLQEPLLKKVTSLLILFSEVTQKALATKEPGIKKEVFNIFRKTASYLMYLSNQGIYLNDICVSLIEQWINFPIEEYSINTAEHLLECVSKLPKDSRPHFLFTKIIEGVFKSKEVSVCSFVEKKIQIYIDEQILYGVELEEIFLKILKFHSDHDDYAEVERLFYKIVNKKIFTPGTFPDLWISLIFLTLPILVNKRNTLSEGTKEHSDMNKKIGEVLSYIFTDPLLRFYLFQLKCYQFPKQFLYLLNEGCAQKRYQDVLLMATQLFQTCEPLLIRGREEITDILIGTLDCLCKTPECFTYSKTISTIDLFDISINLGLFKDRKEDLLELCKLFFESSVFKYFVSTLELGVSKEEFEHLNFYIKKSHFLLEKIILDPKLHLEIIQKNSWILKQTITLLVSASYYEKSYFEKALNMIGRAFQYDLGLRGRAGINAAFSAERDASAAMSADEGIVSSIPKETGAADGASQPAESVAFIPARPLSTKFTFACHMGGAIQAGSQVYLIQNRKIPLVNHQEIFKLIEGNFFEPILIEDLITSIYVYQFFTVLIQDLVIQNESDLIPRALKILFSIKTKYPRHLAECAVSILNKTYRLFNCHAINMELFLNTSRIISINKDLTENHINLNADFPSEKMKIPTIDFPAGVTFDEIDKFIHLETSLKEVFSNILIFHRTREKQHSEPFSCKEVIQCHSGLEKSCLELRNKCYELNINDLFDVTDIYYKNLRKIDITSESSPHLYLYFKTTGIEIIISTFLKAIGPTFTPLISRRIYGDFFTETDKMSAKEFHYFSISLLLGFNKWAEKGIEKIISEEQEHSECL